MAQSDPLFKLRLPPALRAVLQRAAMESGRSLTAEILARLEVSFPSLADRLRVLEEAIDDPQTGLLALAERLKQLEQDRGKE